MTKIKTSIIICLAMMVALSACKAKKQTNENIIVDNTEAPCIMPPKPGHNGKNAHYIPMARIYKTSGNFINNVPINLTPDGSAIMSFPAPSDLTDTSTPVQLAGGFLLDRRGITPNTVFTRYTYDEYRALPAPPTIAELKEAIIPGAMVTEIVSLPFPMSEAMNNLKTIDTLIREGLPGCERIYQAPTLKF